MYNKIKKGDDDDMINEILKHNKEFVANKGYLKFCTDKYPNRKTAIISCMDTRLTYLLPAALGLKNGDVKIIKNAGAQITSDYGSTMKSLIIAIYELGVTEILVIGHDDCGVQLLNGEELIKSMIDRGIDKEVIDHINNEECNLEHWLSGFHDIDRSVNSTVRHIRANKLIPKDVNIIGLIIDPVTGELRYTKPEE